MTIDKNCRIKVTKMFRGFKILAVLVALRKDGSLRCFSIVPHHPPRSSHGKNTHTSNSGQKFMLHHQKQGKIYHGPALLARPLNLAPVYRIVHFCPISSRRKSTAISSCLNAASPRNPPCSLPISPPTSPRPTRQSTRCSGLFRTSRKSGTRGNHGRPVQCQE